MKDRQFGVILACLLFLLLCVLLLALVQFRLQREQIDSLTSRVFELEDWAEDIVPMWKQQQRSSKKN